MTGKPLSEAEKPFSTREKGWSEREKGFPIGLKGGTLRPKAAFPPVKTIPPSPKP